ncbi:hypothetical protein Hypma_009423, partial [Hypsizygus marmoreus]
GSSTKRKHYAYPRSPEHSSLLRYKDVLSSPKRGYALRDKRECPFVLEARVAESTDSSLIVVGIHGWIDSGLHAIWTCSMKSACGTQSCRLLPFLRTHQNMQTISIGHTSTTRSSRSMTLTQLPRASTLHLSDLSLHAPQLPPLDPFKSLEVKA